MRADGLVEAEWTLGDDPRYEAFDMPAKSDTGEQASTGLHTHLSSASSSGPVDTGFRKATGLFCRWTALQRTVETMVLPTLVLAP